MEYGPRALGNRSILYQATDTTVNDWLNKRLKRTEFMPFAPVTLKKYASECYTGLKGAETPAKFMTITLNCTDVMKRNCPAVVHVDGTARPQIIDKDTNTSYYKLLNEYRKITGIPSMINTSFNMHEEPIVCSPTDALKAFKASGLDYLAIGNFLLKSDYPV
jgi:carbamoyltransferase